MSTVIGVRVSRKIKEELEKAGIDVAKKVRKLLEELAWKVRVRRQVEGWDRILSNIKPSAKGFSAKSVRGDCESR